MSEPLDLRRVCERAVATFDRFDQIAKAVEELNELGAALMRTAQNGFEPKDEHQRLAIVDEIADVRIMVEQLTILFGDNNVGERIGFKLRRLDIKVVRHRVDAAMRKAAP